MRKDEALGYIFIFMVMFSGCKGFIFRDVKCRDFALKGEHYWFPLYVGDSVTFLSTSDTKKTFMVVDKYISHRTRYVSDTGCGCSDLTGMLLVSNEDSIWFNNRLKYIEQQEGNYYEDVFLKIDNVTSGFYETHKTVLNSYSIDTLSFSDVERFDYDVTGEMKVKTVFRAKDLGIIKFVMGNDIEWTNENLTVMKETNLDSFNYSENTCK
jgi:hypothetical protein